MRLDMSTMSSEDHGLAGGIGVADDLDAIEQGFLEYYVFKKPNFSQKINAIHFVIDKSHKLSKTEGCFSFLHVEVKIVGFVFIKVEYFRRVVGWRFYC